MSDAKTPDAGDKAEPTIRIISRAAPGFRRGGIAHPADKTYPASNFTVEQLAAIDDEPLLTVIYGDGAQELLEAAASKKSRARARA